MNSLSKEIDLLLEYSLVEAPTRMGALNTAEFTRFDPKEEPESEEDEEPSKQECDDLFEEKYAQYMEQGLDYAQASEKALQDIEEFGCDAGEVEDEEPSEDLPDDCNEILSDPALKGLLKNIEASQTLKRETANMLRNVSLTVDMLAFAVAGGAVGATALFPGANLAGGAFAISTLKTAGFVSGAPLLAASLLGVFNGDYKAAAVDGATGLLSITFAGGGAASKGVKAVGATAGKQATKNIAQRLGAGVAGAAAKVEAKVTAELVARGMAQETAATVAKYIMQQTLNAGSNKLRALLGDIPEQGSMPNEEYKQVLVNWQNQQSEKITEIYDKCFKRAPESGFKKKVRALVRGIDKYVGFTARWLGKATKAVKGLYNKIMGEGTLNESQIKTIKELGLGDMILLKEEKLVTIHIDLTELKKQELNESFLSMFGGWVEHLLGAMFGVRVPDVKVTGSRRDVESFAKTLAGEKNYIEAAKRYGLDHPTTYKNKAKLDTSIKGFERDTGLKWPFE